jgi:hypothetical protein
MCLGTAFLGILLLWFGAGSELGLFGWPFVALGALGAVMWFVFPYGARR